MKILFILENYYPNIGGVETLFKSLVDALGSEGHEITVLTNKNHKSLAAVTQVEKTKIVRVPFFNRYFFTFFAFIPAIYHARGKDLIHTTSYNAGVPAFIAAKLTGKKSIITFHEVWGNLWFKLPFMGSFSKYLHYLFEKMLLKYSFDKFIGVSNFTCSRLKEYGVHSDRVDLVYNGINYDDLPEWKETQSDVFTISYFGRLGISKGLDVFLDAIELLKESTSFHYNLIIPKQPASFRATILDLIKKKGIQHLISIFHHLSDEELKEKLLHSQAVVVPSYSEGFCFSAVEAMAMKIPVISSGRGALKEVISGQYIEAEALSGQAFAQCFKDALEGNWQKTSLKKFELSNTVKAYLDMYKTLMS